MAGRVRRCNAWHPQHLGVQCMGEITEETMHFEDHWSNAGPRGTILRWMDPVQDGLYPQRVVANPERVRADGTVAAPAEGVAASCCGNALGCLRDCPDPVQGVGGLVKSGPAPLGVRSKQVGGGHYVDHKIQPWDIVDEYDLDHYRASALKYLLRAGSKGPKLEDLRKARHCLDKAIEREEAGDGGQ